MNSFMGSTAELAVLIKLKDEITGPLGNIDRSLSHLNTQTATVSGGMSKIGSGLALGAERLAVAGIALGGAMVGIAISATNAAKTYQASMELLRSQTGATQQEVDSMSQSVLAMAGSTGTSADVLAAGLYHIESAGLRGSAALDMLRVSAAGAKTGNADLEDVTNALVGAWQSGVKGAQDMTQAMGTINAIVGSGNMRMQDLTDAMGTGILASAKTFGASMASVGASIATMTDEGIPAADAATRLRMTLSLLGAPTSKARDLFAGIGLSATDLANAMRGPGGLTDAITDLHSHMIAANMIDASGNINTAGAQFLSGAFGGGRSSSAIMTLVGNYDLLISKQKAITVGTETFGASFAATQETVAYKQAALTAGFDALKISLGEKLLPVEANVLDALSELVSDPAVLQGINSFGDALAGMFSKDNIAGAEQFVRDVAPGIKDFATSILPPLVEGLKISGQAAKTIVDLFMGLPAPLQAAIIAVMVGNKLTGGLVASGLGDLAKVAMGAASGTGGGGIAGGLLGVQKVFVVNMGMGGLGGGLAGEAAAGGEAAVGGEAAAGGAAAAGGIGLGTIALVAGAAVSSGIALYLASQAPGQIGDQQAAAGQQVTAWGNKATTPAENAAALAAEVKNYRDLTSNPIGSALTNTFAGSQMADALKTAGDKIAKGATIAPEGIQALKDALAVAQNMGNADLARQLGDDLATAQRRQSLSEAAPSAPAKPVVLSVADRAAINTAANTAHVDVMAQIRGQLDSKKAIADGSAIAKVYGSGTVTNLQWAQKNINELTQVQKAFAARGDTVTAAALGADIAVLRDALAGKLDDVVAAVGANPLNTAPTGRTHYAPDPPTSGGTNQGPIHITTTVSAKDVTQQQNIRSGYRSGVPQ